MLFEILPDPRPLLAENKPDAIRVLQIHRLIPQSVPIGHFDPGGIEVVDDVVSRSTYLDFIQQACAALGEWLEVRFYDHFEEAFDASVLDHLDEIRRLSIDGLETIRHPEAIGRLPRLTSLRFGPRRLAHRGVLSTLGVHRLTDFTLASTPTPAIDLAPLADARALHSLRLLGHGKNPEAVGHLDQLVELAIQPSAKSQLDFLSRLACLETLKFVLGSATSVAAIDTLPRLQDLSFREVRHLEEIGSLERFPRLRRLLLSDQPRVAALHVGRRNASLEHLYLYSVPSLQALHGLSELPALQSLFAYDSRLVLPWSELPPTLTHFRLMTKAMKGRAAHESEVRARGLVPDVHPGSQFFYK